jgi:AbrB family looped-hinge helix DNA binding protein
MKVRVGKRGVVVIPKSVRERLGIKESAFLELDVAGDSLVLKVKDLWTELREKGNGVKFDVDAFERELGGVEEEWLRRCPKRA